MVIYKVEFTDKVDYAQAKNLKKMQEGYKDLIGDEFLDVKKVTILEKGTYEDIKVFDDENEQEILLTELIGGEHFQVLATTGCD